MQSRPRPAHVIVALVMLVVCLGCEQAAEVELAALRRGEIQESFTEPARTRLAKTYPITMPVDGRIARIDLEPGDTVTKGATLVEIDLVSFQQAVAEAEAAVKELEAEVAVKKDNRLEEIAAEDANAAVQAAKEALSASDEEVAAQKARQERAAKDLARKQQLFDRKVVAEDQLDDAKLDAETSLIELRKQEFYRAALKAMVVAVNLYPHAVKEWIAKKGLEGSVLDHKLAQTKARLVLARHQLQLARIVSPIDGIVLERHEQGDRPLLAGQPLLLLGNLGDLEVEADVLTQDALRLAKGSPVTLEPASGIAAIAGKVTRIEPAGFTKLSSLGVEQQRVKVLVELAGEHGALKVGYRLRARFLTGSKADALVVPRFSVLQAPDRSFYVFKAADGKLVRQNVTIGLRSDLELEVTDGLAATDRIVARPDATMEDGMKVTINDRAAPQPK